VVAWFGEGSVETGRAEVLDEIFSCVSFCEKFRERLVDCAIKSS